MMYVLRKLVLLSALFLGATAVVSALPQFVSTAVAADEHDEALKAIKRGDIMSYSQIRKIVQSKLKGRVVNIQLRRTNRGWQYFMRVSKNNGRVVAAVVDARNGKILSTR
ncbi:hypothetical protein KFE96_14685 [Kordiimonas sp. SCSIO 12603]|uniref:PepSY domain-containing protein n=1 Tax=Kordiimonas sp. SCSIO 12603 TaxID=2829596 RepID=UPI002105BBF6|nr:PepSY domain-containing protein [Kordiimonas sp. SCSIO 12603]UTW58055.1 hypothetical protein KFE96_14685 [Kordiimonas sp. SCSIO 12603]